MKKNKIIPLFAVLCMLGSCNKQGTTVQESGQTISTSIGTKYTVNLKVVGKKGIESYKTVSVEEGKKISCDDPKIESTSETSGPDNLKVKTDYKFLGWIHLLNGKTEADVENKLDEEDYEEIDLTKFSFTSDMTLYGLFEEEKSYETLFVNEDGSTIQESRYVKEGEKVVYDSGTPTKASDADNTYAFDYWTTSNGQSYKTLDDVKISAPTKFKAHYISTIRSYSVIFKSNEDGSFKTLSTQSIRKNSYVTSSNPKIDDKTVADSDGLMTKTTYTFKNWIKLKNGKTEADWDKLTSSDYDVFNIETTPITEDITLYAVFTTASSYQVKFCDEDGTVLQAATYVEAGKKVTYSGTTPTKSGSYTFSGWKISDGTSFDLTTEINKTYKLIAAYTYVSTPVLSFVDNKTGKTVCSVSVDSTTEISETYLNNVLNENYWDDEKNEQVRYFEITDAPSENVAMGNDRTYHIDVTTISYDQNGVWPQTKITDTDLIAKIDDDNATISPLGGVNYVKVDGKRYYKDESGTSVVYRKVEPIKWIKLAGEWSTGATVISEKVLTKREYCKITTVKGTWQDYQNTRTIDGLTVYYSNYKYSDIREWLNDDFIDNTFVDSSLLQVTTVDNSINSYYGGYEYDKNPDAYPCGSSSGTIYINKYVCANTEDKVWLLSFRELFNTVKESYSKFGVYSQTDTASLAKRIAYDVDGTASVWITRTPNCCNNPANNYPSAIKSVSLRGMNGTVSKCDNVNNDIGIRPVVQFKL